MSKMHYFSNIFSKVASAGGFPPPAPLNIGDLKFRDLAK